MDKEKFYEGVAQARQNLLLALHNSKVTYTQGIGACLETMLIAAAAATKSEEDCTKLLSTVFAECLKDLSSVYPEVRDQLTRPRTDGRELILPETLPDDEGWADVLNEDDRKVLNALGFGNTNIKRTLH